MQVYHLHRIFPKANEMPRDRIIYELDRMITETSNYLMYKQHKFMTSRCTIRMNSVMSKRFMEVCSDDYRYDFTFNPVSLTYHSIQVISDNRLVPGYVDYEGQILISYDGKGDIKMTANDMVDMVDSLRYSIPKFEFDVADYCKNDACATEAIFKEVKKMGPNDGWNGSFKFDVDWRKAFKLTPPIPKIKKVIFHNPATIVFWEDGTKTVVKAQEGDDWNSEKGLAMAIVKKTIGLKEFYNQYIKAEGDI